MLIQPIIDKLSTLKLAGMREGLQEQMENPAYKKLSFEERLGLLLDREWSLRQDRKQRRRVRVARFREAAVLEDVEFSSSRGLDRSQVLALSQDDWIRSKLNVIITGPTGAGKTFLACAHGQAACRNGFSVRYFQISKLLQKLMFARADGSLPKFLDTIAKTQLLLIDDWLCNPLTDAQTPDLLGDFKWGWILPEFRQIIKIANFYWLLLAWLIYATGKSLITDVQRAREEEIFNLRELWIPVVFFFGIFIISISFYAQKIYPKIHPAFTGGKPLPAEILVSEEGAQTLISLGALTTEDRFVKDISIIHETPSTIYITLPQTGRGQRINCIALPKSTVASIAVLAETHE